jgi:hypothetical protein
MSFELGVCVSMLPIFPVASRSFTGRDGDADQVRRAMPKQGGFLRSRSWAISLAGPRDSNPEPADQESDAKVQVIAMKWPELRVHVSVMPIVSHRFPFSHGI